MSTPLLAFDIGVYVHGLEGSKWKAQKDAIVCASIETKFPRRDIEHLTTAMKPRRTNSDGRQRFQFGNFDAFDGQIVLAAKKQGFCPQICVISTKWNSEATEEEQRAGGNWMPLVPPSRMECYFKLNQYDSSNCGITNRAGDYYDRIHSNQRITESDPYTSHTVVKISSRRFESLCKSKREPITKLKMRLLRQDIKKLKLLEQPPKLKDLPPHLIK